MQPSMRIFVLLLFLSHHATHTCSLFAYIGSLLCKGHILQGLERLEFRGYDAAGFACLDAESNCITTVKTTGKVAELKKLALSLPWDGFVGIGHTRWATHGQPTTLNAHPHTSNDHSFVMVHNGVVENFHALKQELITQGYIFVSETDSEVIAHLFVRAYKNSNNLKTAALATIQQLQGACTFIGLHKDHPDELIVVRQRAPLCIGIAPDGMSIASDFLAFADATDTVYFIPDRTIALVRRNEITAFDYAGNPLAINTQKVPLHQSAYAKLDHEHFMLKEIYEQKAAIQATVAYCKELGDNIWHTLGLTTDDIQTLNAIKLFGCGASWHSGFIGQLFFEHIANIPASAHVASELRLIKLFPSLNTLYMAISQSGETTDVVELLRSCNQHDLHTVALTNVQTSSLMQEAHGGIATQAGPEMAVVATKTFTSQVALLYWLAHRIALQRGCIYAAQMAAAELNLLYAADVLERMIEEHKPAIIALAQQLAHARNVIFLGRHITYPLALEAALKLKETSYICAEGYPAGELRHGNIVLIDEQTPTILFSHQDPVVYQKLVGNAQEVKTRKGQLTVFAFAGQDELITLADTVFIIPPVAPLLEPIAMAGLMQFFAYHVGIALGRDVDRPRNLAKTMPKLAS
jgi:glucosamine--fructose-6-phosphate aminotransferase (isomerizing)